MARNTGHSIGGHPVSETYGAKAMPVQRMKNISFRYEVVTAVLANLDRDVAAILKELHICVLLEKTNR